MTRCTCVYRASTATERDAGRAVITVEVSDPWCPAADVHARAGRPVVAADAPRT